MVYSFFAYKYCVDADTLWMGELGNEYASRKTGLAEERIKEILRLDAG